MKIIKANQINHKVKFFLFKSIYSNEFIELQQIPLISYNQKDNVFGTQKV